MTYLTKDCYQPFQFDHDIQGVEIFINSFIIIFHKSSLVIVSYQYFQTTSNC